MKKIIAIICVFMLSACATVYDPIPEGYVGDTATIKDYMTDLSDSNAHYFMCIKVDGKYIENSWGATRGQNYGRGMIFDPVITTRKVLPVEQTLTLQGLVFFPTDAQSLFGDEMAVTHDFIFTPIAGETYTVKGELSKDGSTIWLEDFQGNVVDGSEKKAEIN